MRASDPLTINKLKRSDSIFDKVKNLNENYFGRESLKKKRQEVIAEVDEEEKEHADADDKGLLTTEGGENEANNVYFKNIPIHIPHGGTPKEEDPVTHAKEANYEKEEDEKTENVDEEEAERERLSRQLLYDKSRRSMSMINPREKAKLQNLLMPSHQEIQEEEKEIVELPDAKDERRNSIDMKDFYDERPNNAIFLETSKE